MLDDGLQVSLAQENETGFDKDLIFPESVGFTLVVNCVRILVRKCLRFLFYFEILKSLFVIFEIKCMMIPFQLQM